MKFLNLILYTSTEYYDCMYFLLNKFYKSHSNVLTLFIMYNDTVNEPVNNNDIIFLKQTKKNISPNIKNCLEAFHFIIDNFDIDDIDYAICSNITTIIDFDLLEKELKKNHINVIKNETSLLFSKKMFDMVLKTKNIETLIFKNDNDIKFNEKIINMPCLLDPNDDSYVIKNIVNKGYIFYENKCKNEYRFVDILQMENIIDSLNKKIYYKKNHIGL